MTQRTMRSTMTFSKPFLLTGFDEPLPAGAYMIEICGSAFKLGLRAVASQTVDSSRKQSSQGGPPSTPIEGHLMKRFYKINQCSRCSMVIA
jgi:hypothetical protein